MMTTMMQSGTMTAPNWRLGEIGEVIKERMNMRIDDVNQLSLYMQRNEADLIYGTRILAQLEAILAEVRRSGISRDSAVAVESIRPGTIPSSVRNMLTSNYSKTHQRETIVALESWANAGRFGLIAMLVMAIVKIIGWIISNGNAFGGAAASSPDEYVEAVAARAADMVIDGETVINSIKTTTLKDAYIRAVKDIDQVDLEEFNIQIMLADDTLSSMNAEDYLNTLAANIKRSPFEGLFKDYKGKRANSQMVIHDILDALLKLRVTSAVYEKKIADEAAKMLPKGVRETGVLIPTETVFFSLKGVVSQMENWFAEFNEAFNKMRSVDLEKLHQDKSTWQEVEGVERSYEVEKYFKRLQYALRGLNNEAGIILQPRGSRNRFDTNAVYPAVMKDIRPVDADGLIGWEPQGELGDFLLLRASDSTYLCLETLAELNSKYELSVDDERAILAVVIKLGPSAMTRNYKVTDMNAYSRLQKAMDGFVKELDKWQAKMDKSPEFMHWMSENLKAMAGEEDLAPGHSPGRDLQNMFTLTGQNYFDSLRTNLGFVRTICSGMAVLQNVIRRSAQNPFVKHK